MPIHANTCHYMHQAIIYGKRPLQVVFVLAQLCIKGFCNKSGNYSRMYFELLKKDFLAFRNKSKLNLHVLPVDTCMSSNVIIALSILKQTRNRLQLFCRSRIIANDKYFDFLVDILVTRITGAARRAQSRRGVFSKMGERCNIKQQREGIMKTFFCRLQMR